MSTKREQVLPKNRPEDKNPAPKMSKVYLTPDGREMPRDIPMAPPLGYKPQDPLHKRIREMIIGERLAQEARERGMETFDESDDFDIGDDIDPTSPYEEHFDPWGFEPGAARAAIQRGREAPPSSTLPEDKPAPAPSSNKKPTQGQKPVAKQPEPEDDHS